MYHHNHDAQHEDKPSTSNTVRPAKPARPQLPPIKVGESELLAGFDAAAGSPTHHARRHKRQGDVSPRVGHPLKKPRPAAPAHRGDALPKPASKQDAKAKPRDRKQLPGRSKPKPQPNSDSGTHAKTIDAGGNSSTAAASTRPDMQDSQSERKRPSALAGGATAAAVKAENVATSSQQPWPDARRGSRAVPVQQALASGASSALGLLNVNEYASYEQLRMALTRLIANQGSQEEGERSPTLVYRDAVGDWLLLSPEEPWSLFQSTVQALMIM